MSAAEHEASGHGQPPPFAAPGGGADDAIDIDALVRGAEAAAAERGAARSKKKKILELYDGGMTDVAEIVMTTHVRPSYVGQVLRQERGLAYFDLYTSGSDDGEAANVYTRFFKKVLAFKDVAAARESVLKISRLYDYFGRLGDRAGQHEAMALALKGLNRARFIRKYAEAEVFFEFLVGCCIARD
jgi:hypothetical protein